MKDVSEKMNRYHEFLEELYSLLKDGGAVELKMKDLLRKHTVYGSGSVVLINSKIISKSGSNSHSKWTWLDPKVKPTFELAKQFFTDCDVALKEYQANYRKQNPQNNNMSKTDNRVFGVPTEDKLNRIKGFLDDMYTLMKGAKHPISSRSLKLNEQAEKYKLYASLQKVFRESDILEKHGDSPITMGYKWIGPKPSIKMAEELNFAESEYTRGMQQKTAKNKDGSTKSNSFSSKHSSSSDGSKKDLYKQLAKKFIDLDDPEAALAALNKM